jgi:hypothetical protein
MLHLIFPHNPRSRKGAPDGLWFTWPCVLKQIFCQTHLHDQPQGRRDTVTCRGVYIVGGGGDVDDASGQSLETPRRWGGPFVLVVDRNAPRHALAEREAHWEGEVGWGLRLSLISLVNCQTMHGPLIYPFSFLIIYLARPTVLLSLKRIAYERFLSPHDHKFTRM